MCWLRWPYNKLRRRARKRICGHQYLRSDWAWRRLPIVYPLSAYIMLCRAVKPIVQVNSEYDKTELTNFKTYGLATRKGHLVGCLNKVTVIVILLGHCIDQEDCPPPSPCRGQGKASSKSSPRLLLSKCHKNPWPAQYWPSHSRHRTMSGFSYFLSLWSSIRISSDWPPSCLRDTGERKFPWTRCVWRY